MDVKHDLERKKKSHGDVDKESLVGVDPTRRSGLVLDPKTKEPNIGTPEQRWLSFERCNSGWTLLIDRLDNRQKPTLKPICDEGGEAATVAVGDSLSLTCPSVLDAQPGGKRDQYRGVGAMPAQSSNAAMTVEVCRQISSDSQVWPISKPTGMKPKR